MKKAIAILVLGLLLSVNANSATTKFRTGSLHEGDFYWDHKKISLPPGKWETVEKWNWSIGFWTSSDLTLAQHSNNYLTSLYGFGDIDFKGRYQGYIAPFIYEELYNDKYDGCYERTEYTLLKTFQKGKVHNCFIVSHAEVNKELNRPDDAESKVYSAIFRKWIKDKNIKLPKIMLCADGVYYAPVVRDTFYTWSYCIDPESFGASKNKFFTEESSEYHPSNIHNFPDKKNFMHDWVITTAKMHKLLELTFFKAKEHHKLDFSEYNIEEINETNKVTSGSQLTEQLKELHELYKAGVLTQEEFTKAKKKLLN